jgi:hypothetical protein
MAIATAAFRSRIATPKHLGLVCLLVSGARPLSQLDFS